MNIFNSLAGGTVGSTAFRERLAIVVRTVTTALRDPAHNPLVMLATLGVVGLALLIILMLVALIVGLVQDWRNPPPAPTPRVAAPTTQRNTLLKVFVWTMVMGVVLVGAAFGWRYAISDKACARCHFTKAAFASRATDTHAKVACSACHVAPGARGAFLSAVAGARNLRSQLAGPPKRASFMSQVESDACLACHKSITTGVVVAGSIRMRHSDVFGVGYDCTDCHTVGHGASAIRVRKSNMAQCIQCHDGTKASSACATCHSKDVGVAAGQSAALLDIPKATIVVDGCRGCHTMTPCIRCHGLELPHSSGFIAGTHARKALLEPQVCVKCHRVTSFCNGCHQFTVSAGGLPTGPHGTTSQFVADHSKLGRTFDQVSASCSCHTKGGPRALFCADCHGPQPSR